MTATETAPTGGPATRPGKFITFLLGPEAYGLPVQQVLEIIRCIDIARVPCMPRHILGVTNMRGQIVPVIDLRLKFNLSEAAIDDKTCTIVIQARTHTGNPAIFGLMVDKVCEVVEIAAGQIELPADYGGGIDPSAVLCIARINDSMASLLDLTRVLQEELTACG
jgi:purine-binding chemotaxis protein CheW